MSSIRDDESSGLEKVTSFKVSNADRIPATVCKDCELLIVKNLTLQLNHFMNLLNSNFIIL